MSHESDHRLFERVSDWLEAISMRGVNLTSWEEEFVESLDRQMQAGRTPTDRQAAIVERIYTERVP